tara:strand:+ start:1255 stop:2100 length:846 start_codon:yes stop_codon:yes gene_type:complete
MANESTTTSLNDLLSPLVAEALFVANEQSIMRGLVRNYTMPMNSGKTLQVPIYPTVSAVARSEAQDLSNTEVTTNKADLTVSEVGVMTTLTDFARTTSESDVVADLGRLFGEAIAKKIDQDLIALFDGFSTSIGGAGTELSIDNIFKAVATLRQAGVPGPYYGVFNPKVIYNVKKTLTNTFVNPNAGDLQNEAMRTGFIGQIAGVNIFESSNVDGTTDTDNCKGGIFSRDAIGFALMQDLKIETQRDASLRATEIVATAVYGAGELHDSYGIEMLNESVIN